MQHPARHLLHQSEAGMEIYKNAERTRYVAIDTDRTLGHVQVCPCVEGFEVCRMWVEEEFRGRGVASALLSHVIYDYVDEKLVGYTDNDEMKHVFENLGFTKTKNYDYFEHGG